MPLRKPLEERFWLHVRKTDRCWIWTAQVNTEGYGVTSERHVGLYAHRVSWEIAHPNEPIPSGFYICHHCDNRRCVRPDHLFLGTNSDNQLDAKRKGRLPLGEYRPAAKLTARDVVEIRSRYRVGERPSKLAREFGVTISTVSDIIHERTWRHIP